ncbi:MAG: Omp28-related outer membrane protein [Ignavibacteria bacterium]|nr:Omp28-related outer membrane protein [Ignavibacteria bacterium]
MKHSIILAGLLSLVLISCDVMNAPYEKKPKDPSDTLLKDTSTTITRTGALQNVLLEDYTGQLCGNCPEAADIADRLYKTNGGRVIVTAIHAGIFAKKEMPDYEHDFTTPTGDALDAAFKISRAGNPNGLVNRVTINNRIIQGHPTWETVVAQQLQRSPALELGMSHTYYPETKTLVVTVRTEALADIDAPTNVSVWLQENDIIADQKDYRKTPSHITDYNFSHVLRASMNGTWGDTLSKAPSAKGTKSTMTFRYTFPDVKLNTADTLNYWDVKNFEIVAFAHKASTSKEVLQVVKQKM